MDKHKVNVNLAYAELVKKPAVWAGDLKVKVAIVDCLKHVRKSNPVYILELNPSQLDHLMDVLFIAKKAMLDGVQRHVASIGIEPND
jgi:hypothetical protein